MNPAPPVINARTRLSFPSGNHGPRLEGVHGRGNLVDFVVAQGGVKRQREYLVARARRNRTLGRVACAPAPAAAGSAPGSESAFRRRSRRDAPASVASRSADPDDEQMVDVAGVALRQAASTGRAASTRAVAWPPARAAAPSSRCRRRQPSRAESAACMSSRPRVDARLLMMIAVALSAVAQPLRSGRPARRSLVTTAPPSPSAPRFLVG